MSDTYIKNYGFPTSSIKVPVISSTPTTKVSIHATKSNSGGPPLLLLHGYPQNLLIWHRVAPQLTAHFTVIAMDLRGYGRSSKPAADDKHETYSKRVMACDCVEVMRYFGFKKFFVCGHDRGARVAHKLCVLYPEVVRKCMFLDIAPTMAM